MAGRPISMSFVAEFENFNRFNNDMRHRAANMGPWFDVYARIFQLAEETHFESVGVFGGVGDLWAIPYSKSYAEWKQGAVGHQTKEYLYGNLYRSLTSTTPYSVRIETKQTVAPGAAVLASASIEMGTSVPYAELQQYGSESLKARRRRSAATQGSLFKLGKKAVVPPRPPVLEELPDVVMNALGVSLMDYLTSGVTAIPRF